ncbi:hypothetical protein PV08_00132 [Exophiala spinifera]|uniref:BTB domain-containing protein n=1 Tax=Exophiala spinifera TaxID=91928 RepID=A0A0D2C7N8_9EURO|nr:uncharacterized protein PV08_00132 [Exophiala spinifera]KIW19559.1 hypothetical protein PV08_00132 [Exophiala spinifera]
MAASTNNAYLEFLTTGKYTDLIIRCQEVEFKVHRLIVCTQSDMLDKACGGLFQEAESGSISFPEIEPENMARVILFMYTGNYHACRLPNFYKKLINDSTEDTEGEEDEEEDETARYLDFWSRNIDHRGLRTALRTNVLMYQCADMLCCERLRQLACARFLNEARLAYDLDGFDEPLRIVYESTRVDDKDLRFEVTCLCIEYSDLKTLPEMTAAVFEEYNPGFWNFSIEVNKRKGNRIKTAVKDFNEKMASSRCFHHKGCVKEVELELVEYGDSVSFYIVCTECGEDF